MQVSTLFMLKLRCTCSYTIIEVRQLKKSCTVPSKSTENCVSKMVIFRQRMTPQERLRAIEMIQAGLSHRQVVVTLNRDHRIIDRLWDRYIQTGMTTDRLCSARPSVTFARDDQYIVTCALRQRTLNSRCLREQFRAGTNINVSDQTIRNPLHARNLRARRPVVRQLLTRQQRIARQQWAISHRRWTCAEWRMVMFSDKSRYNVDHHDDRTHVWRWPGEEYTPPYIALHDRWGGGSVMGLGWYYEYRENQSDCCKWQYELATVFE